MLGCSRQLERLRPALGKQVANRQKAARFDRGLEPVHSRRVVQCELDLAASEAAQTLTPMSPVRLIGSAQQPQVTAAAPACITPDLFGAASRTAHVRRCLDRHLRLQFQEDTNDF